MTETSIILLVIVALVAIALLWLLLGRSRTNDVPPPQTESVADVRPLDRVAASVPDTPPPPPAVPPAAQGVLPGTLSEMAPPIAAPSAKPAPFVAQPADDAPPAGEGDNLAIMKGVGPKIVALLHAEGITRFAQIAAWTDADIDVTDAKMGNFRGRIRRDNWVDQARYLAAGDRAGYEAKYGKL